MLYVIILYIQTDENKRNNVYNILLAYFDLLIANRDKLIANLFLLGGTFGGGKFIGILMLRRFCD